MHLFAPAPLLRWSSVMLVTLLGTRTTALAVDAVAVRMPPGATGITIGTTEGTPIADELSLVNTSTTPIDAITVVIGAGAVAGDQLAVTGALPAGVTQSSTPSTFTLAFTAGTPGSVSAAQWQSLLRTLTFRTTSTVAGARTITVALGGAKPYSANGHFYEVVTPGTTFAADGRVSWTQAVAAAAARPRLFGLTPYLATINTAGESAFISEKVNEATWVGGTDDATQLAAAGVTWTAEGDFYWATGPEKGQLISRRNRGQGSPPGPVTSTFANWNSGEPNNSNPENFIQLLANSLWNDLPDASYAQASWNASGIYTVRKYLVEYGGLPGDPAITLQDSRTVSVGFPAPVISAPASPQAAARPVLQGRTGRGEGPVQVRVTLDLTDDGAVDAVYDLTTAADGAWSLPTASAVPTSGAISDLATASRLRVTATTFNAGAAFAASGAQPGPATTAVIVTDRTPPSAPTLVVPAQTADVTPTINGTAEPGSRVTVSIDPDGAGPLAAVVLEVTADAVTGAWSVTPSTALAASPASLTGTVTATATDAVGNASSAATATLRLDTEAPPSPVIARPGARTGVALPEIGGTAEPGALVTLTVDQDGDPATADAVTYQTQADPTTGAWSVPLASAVPTAGVLASGGLVSGRVPRFSAVATDAVGNTSVTAQSSTVVDTVPPAAPVFTGPASPVASAFPVLTGTGEAGATLTLAVDTDGDPATTTDVVTYAVTVDSTGAWAVDTALTAPTAGALPTTGLPSGTVLLATAVQQDAVGHQSPSTAFQVVIDTVAPAAPVLTGPASPTNQSRPTLSGTAEPLSTVTIRIATSSGEVTFTAPVAADGTWSVTPTDPLETVNGLIVLLSATATDAAGNRSPATQRDILIDTTPPEVPTLRTPAPATRQATPILTGTADTELASGGSLAVIIDPTGDGDLTDALRYAPVTVSATGTWSLDVAQAIPEGATVPFAGFADAAEVLVYLQSIDLAGNASAGSGGFLVDLTAPTAPTIERPVSPVAERTPVLGGTAEPASVVLVTLTLDGVDITWRTTTDASGRWAVDTTATPVSGTLPVGGLPDGAVALRAQATDAAGNTGPTTTATLQVDATAPTAPVLVAVEDDTGTAGDFATRDQTLTLSGTAEAGSRVTVQVDGVTVGSAVADSSGRWRLDATGTTLAAGSHTLSAVATDAAGNRSPSAQRSLQIDTETPAPVIRSVTTDTGRSTTDGITRSATFRYEGTAEAGAVVTVAVDGLPVGSVVTAADGTWSWAPGTVFPDGTYAVTATAVDAVGNLQATVAHTTVTVDTRLAAPTLLGLQPDTGTAGDRVTATGAVVLVGTGEPGSTVGVSLAGGPAQAVTVASDGTWTLDLTASPLPEGSLVVSLTSEDVAGNTSTGADTTLVVDLTAPTTPTITGISDDTGASATDLITAGTQQVVYGTAEAGTVVTVRIDGAVAGTATTASDGTWAVDLTARPFQDGTYLLTAVAQDRAGLVSDASAARTLVVDTGASTGASLLAISDDTGTAGDFVTADTTLILTGQADPGATVDVFSGGALLGSAVAGPTGAWSLDLQGSPFTPGTRSLTWEARDAAGNRSGLGGPRTLVIDPVAPTAPVVTAISDDTGRAGDFITSDATLLVQGSAEPGTVVTLTVDGVALPPVVTGADGQWVVDRQAFPLADGAHTLSATAVDPAGSTSPASTPMTLVVDGATPATPVITGISPDTGTSASDQQTSATTVTLQGRGTPGSTVTVTLDGAVQGTALVDAQGAWSFLLAGPLAEGTYTAQVSAQSPSGVASAGAATKAFTVDTTCAAPIVTALSDDTGTLGDGVTADTTLAVQGTAEPGSRVTVFRDGQTIGDVTADSTGAWSLAHGGAALADGTYVFTAQAVDAAGTTSARSAGLAMTVVTEAPATPVLTGISDDTGSDAHDLITTDQTLDLHGTAEAGNLVSILLEGVPLGTTTADATGAWTFDATATVLPAGAYAISLQATNAAGLTSGISPVRTVVVDTTNEPAAALLTLTTDSGIIGDRITSDTSIVVGGMAEPGATVTLTGLGATPLAVTANAVTGAWSAATSLTDGTYAVTLASVDGAGNPSGPYGPFAVVIDTQAPAAPLIDAISPDTGTAGDFLTSSTAVQIHGQAEPGSTVQVTLDGAALAAVTADSTGRWSTATTTTTPGSHALTAVAADVAGNRSTTATGNFTVQTATTVPTVEGLATDTGVAGDRITATAAPTLVGRAQPGATVHLREGAVMLGTGTAASDGTWSITTALPLADGLHDLSATAIDAAGFTADSTAPLTITIDTVTPVPTLTTTTPTTGPVTTLTGTAEAAARVSVRLGDQVVGQATADHDGQWTLTLPAPWTAPGTVTVALTATDRAGTTATGEAQIQVLGLPVAAPTITGISPGSWSAATGLTNATTTTLTGTAPAGATVVVTVGAAAPLYAVADALGSWSVQPPALPEGSLAVSVVAEGVDGARSAAATGTLVVDRSAPAAPQITGLSGHGNAVPNGGATTDHQPMVAGTAEPGAQIRLWADGVLVGTATADGTGAWQITPTSPLTADGPVVFTATATDAAGWTGTTSAEWSVAVLEERDVVIEGSSCGSGSLIGLLLGGLAALTLGSWPRRPRPQGRRLVILLGLTAALGTSLTAAETAPAPVTTFAYGAKVPIAMTAEAPAAEAANPESAPRDPLAWEVRLLVGTMPRPEQEASYLRGGLDPGRSSWDQGPRIDLQAVRGWDLGLPVTPVVGVGLGWLRVEGEETPDASTAGAFGYRVDALPVEGLVGLRRALSHGWTAELAAVVGLGPSRASIDAPATLVGNLRAASGSTIGLYTEYGLAATVLYHADGWVAGLQGRYLRGRHSLAFERRERINGVTVSTEPYDIRLDQVGLAGALVVGREF